MPKRGYSREFTPQTERRVRFEIDRIPPTLYEAVKSKAKGEGVSLRALTLKLWKEWAIEAPRERGVNDGPAQDQTAPHGTGVKRARKAG